MSQSPAGLELAAVTIDCPSAGELADFYHRLTGWKITYSEGPYAAIDAGGTTLYFQGVTGHRAPQWPDPDAPQQFHLDLYVDDLDQGEEQALRAGAAKPDFQPGEDKWRVFTDPAGHPFCLCVRAE